MGAIMSHMCAQNKICRFTEGNMFQNTDGNMFQNTERDMFHRMAHVCSIYDLQTI